MHSNEMYGMAVPRNNSEYKNTRRVLFFDRKIEVAIGGLESLTFEITGLRAFLRSSGGLMGWAYFCVRCHLDMGGTGCKSFGISVRMSVWPGLV